ncbi:hypothetical protein EIN_085900 [Entamoeba invadens IP1]|uniref:hypothetical protein n=1 Tax=Entamoeba invadens IP1 TaxID=370355 RepID=UPI0002C3F87A|nr:hypothetical protein EIN_085900 [Entamoeba invadens IP1]ELP85338.1 hypothetical protein EIN_085900 [Entamoeba invadens IP1]|eukprot:XP_004184684.1 hypothetical protein EIN_085900 [Entamoeba invadens IP1]
MSFSEVPMTPEYPSKDPNFITPTNPPKSQKSQMLYLKQQLEKSEKENRRLFDELEDSRDNYNKMINIYETKISALKRDLQETLTQANVIQFQKENLREQVIELQMTISHLQLQLEISQNYIYNKVPPTERTSFDSFVCATQSQQNPSRTY